MSLKQKNDTILYWFRNDLRLHDSEALLQAAKQAQHVIPVYCIDPKTFVAGQRGFAKTGVHKAKFLLQSLRDLQHLLREKGGDLLIRSGKPDAVVFALAKYHNAKAVYCHEAADQESTAEDERLESNLATIGVPLRLFWGSTLHHFDDLPFEIDDLPNSFEQYRRLLQTTSARAALPPPETLRLPPDVAGDTIPTLNELRLENPNYGKGNHPKFKGGETHGLLRLKQFLYKSDVEAELFAQLAYGIGQNKQSLLSPWLSTGSLSPRTIYHELAEYERQHPHDAPSCRHLVKMLMLRDFMQFAAVKDSETTAWQNASAGSPPQPPDLFETWRSGNTGFPIVDAAMRRLNQTGWLPHWARQVAASFYLHYLPCPAAAGEAYFASQLVDADACNNRGNWQQIATQKPPNLPHLAKQHDPNGLFVKKWCPELKKLPSTRIHQPHLLNELEQRVLHTKLGTDYPLPCIKIETA